MGERVTIQLEVYVPFRGRRIWRGGEQVPAGTTVGTLLAALAITEGDLAVLVGGRHAAPTTILKGGEAVAILRQSDGG
ncbi:MAG TPA: MoaD/ThiS family protein [Symbiobacteriaceae bacterium]|nr:MoaD/ThiS family protein [Symbiobacteriaceae bacterium]